MGKRIENFQDKYVFGFFYICNESNT